MAGAIRNETRVVGLTWVHSSPGLKIPVGKMAAALKTINDSRSRDSRFLLVLDGVHGFGMEKESFEELGCDFFIAGCHKWIYGLRGTGIVAAIRQAWQAVNPMIPSFTEVMDLVIEGKSRPAEMDGKQMIPGGGFHSLEYRWALCDAFRWLMSLGKEEVYQRVHSLNRRCQEGPAAMRHVVLHTPMDDHLSSGIISFEIKGLSTEDAVEEQKKRKVTATASPYRESWVRFTPGIINTEKDIVKALDAVEQLKQ